METFAGNQLLPKKTSISFLYENPIGRLFLNEESRSIWTACRKPYKEGVISLAQNEPDLDKDPLRSAYVNSIPRCKNYRGLLLQGYLISPKFMRELPDFEIRQDDLFICSYPRSGTTWMEEIVSCVTSNFDQKFMSKKVHDRVVHLEAGRTFGQGRYLRKLKSPRLLGTHLPMTHCPNQLKDLKCKIVYIARNPKDQAVSYFYFHSTAKYLGKKKWNWDTFLSLFTNGHLVYGSWYQHVKDWFLISRQHPDRVMFITYEELQVNLDHMLAQIADFVGIHLHPDTVSQIATHCRFQQMQKNPAVNREEVPVTDLFVPTEFMRKGIIGDWKNHFSDEQSRQFDAAYVQKMSGLDLEFAYDAESAKEMVNRKSIRGINAMTKGKSESSLASATTELMIEQPDHKTMGTSSGSKAVHRKSTASQTMETRIQMSNRRRERNSLPVFSQDHGEIGANFSEFQAKNGSRDTHSSFENHNATDSMEKEIFEAVRMLNFTSTQMASGSEKSGSDEEKEEIKQQSSSQSSGTSCHSSSSQETNIDRQSHADITSGKKARIDRSQTDPPISPSPENFDRVFPMTYRSNGVTDSSAHKLDS